MFADGQLDVFDDLLARLLRGHIVFLMPPLRSGNDEPETLSHQITLFGLIGAEIR